MTSPSLPLTRLTLDELHREYGARMGPFAGFEMPIQYVEGLKAEHLHTRQKAGLFDVSHMGQIDVTARSGAPGVLWAQLEAALPVDFEGWAVGLQRYTVLLNEDGGIEDDLMLIRLPERVRIIANAGNRQHDLALLRARCPDLEFTEVDAALLALQGPRAEAVLSALDPQAARLKFLECAELDLLGVACLTSRSGYTGEDGYELSVPSAHAVRLVRALLAHEDVRWVGLGARDTLRLEAGLPLHGQDIGPQVTPVGAGLKFAIGLARRPGKARAGGYTGAAAVTAQWQEGAPRTLVALRGSQPTPVRAHTPLQDAHGQVVGEVTSGTVSPTLGIPIMMALVDTAVASAGKGSTLNAMVRGKAVPVTLDTLPFVPKQYRR